MICGRPKLAHSNNRASGVPIHRLERDLQFSPILKDAANFNPGGSAETLIELRRLGMRLITSAADDFDESANLIGLVLVYHIIPEVVLVSGGHAFLGQILQRSFRVRDVKGCRIRGLNVIDVDEVYESS